MKMKSAKIKHMGLMPMDEKDGYFPTLTMTDKSMPEMKDMKVGDTMMIKAKVKIKGISADNSGVQYTTEVQEVACYEEKE
jgi:hypothetical protein